MLFFFLSSAKIKKLKSCHGCCKLTKVSYPERMIVHSNVKDEQIAFHRLSVNEEKQKAWIQAVSRGNEDFEKTKHFKVCLNHFLDGKPNKCHPDPTLSLKILQIL